jgi:hypothetical protein
MKTADPKAAAGRAFVRSLNILLKLARLYGYDHVRTAEQLQIAWEELREAIPEGTESGLLLGASGAQLLLDGVPLEGAPAEKQFAQLLSAAGLASIQFYPCITEKELASFVHAFPTGKSKPSELAQQLKDALADARGVRVNEVCFVATDSRLRDTSLAAQLAAAALGEEQDQFRKMLNDPQKLLELIAAAEGRNSGSDTASFTAGVDGSGAGGNGSGNGNGGGNGTGDGFAGGNGIGAMNGLTGGLPSTMGSAAGNGYGPDGGSGRGGNGSGEPSEEDIYGILRALSTFGQMGTTQNPTAAALEFQGQVTQMPSRAQDMRSYVLGLIVHGDTAEANGILQNYARCTDSEEPDARKRAVTGLSELAGLYAQADPRLLAHALRHVGLRLSVEQDQDLQSLVSAAFVRLSQEAAAKRCFVAMEQALDLLAGVEAQRPGIAKSLRPKMGIEERVPEFVEEALRARQISAGLTGVLKQLPQTAMEQLAGRLNRCQYREDLDNVANLAQDLGEEALQCLRSTVRGGPHAEAVEMVGMLTRLDPQAAKVFLPGRIKDFPRAAQDRMIRQISACGAPERCRILLSLLDHVDPLVMPIVVDEIGMTGDRETLGRLLTLADGDLPAGSSQFLRVKAIEALGRLEAPESLSALRRILESRKVFRWAHAQELRIAALQVLEKLDPEWAKEYLPVTGIEHNDLGLTPLDTQCNSVFVRQRRHTRVRLHRTVSAVSTNLKQNCRFQIKTASLTGGLASTNMHLAPGTQVQLRMQLGLRNLQATALMRDYRAQDMAFEIVDMGLEERTKFRQLLLESMVKSGAAGN